MARGLEDASEGLRKPLFNAPNNPALVRWFQQKILHIFF